jgi:uncharacterized protein YggE
MLSFAIGMALATAAPAADPPRIVVNGYGNVKTPPNVATITYDVVGEGKSSDEALKALVAIAARVEQRLLTLDPDIQPKSSTLSVVGVRGTDCKTNDYDEDDHPKLSSGVCAIAGYVAKQGYSAKTQRIADVGTMVGLAGRNGAKRPEINSFDIADTKAAKNRAIAAALADARSKAEAVAQGSGVGLGAMVAVQLDGASNRDLDEAIVVTGSRLVRPEIDAPAPITVKMSPRPIDTSASVTVTYSIE